MAFAWSAALSPTQILRHHTASGRDGHAFVPLPEQKFRYNFHSVSQKCVRPKQSGTVFLCATLGETVEEDKDLNSSKNEDSSPKSDIEEKTNPQTISSANPFVGAKISSQIAARGGLSTNGKGQASKSPQKPASSNLDAMQPQASPDFSFKPSGPRTFSPKPLGSQGGRPVSSTSLGTGKLKEAKPSVFVNSRDTAGVFKEPGPKGMLDTLRRPDEKSTKFGQPIVPKNLFDEPEKLTAEDKKRFDFTFNAGQLILIFSFLTIIGVMIGTAVLVWKLGAIHYNEY